jgi:hypothetical protein
VRTCPACATENAETGKFCFEVRSASRGGPGRAGSAQVVTVVFADMVGST